MAWPLADARAITACSAFQFLIKSGRCKRDSARAGALQSLIKSVRCKRDQRVQARCGFRYENFAAREIRACRRAVIADRRVKVKEAQALVLRSDRLALVAADSARSRLAAALQAIFAAVPDVIVAGIPTVGRCVIQSEARPDGSGAPLLLNMICSLSLTVLTAAVRHAQPPRRGPASHLCVSA